MKKLLGVIFSLSIFIMSAFPVFAEDVPEAVIDAANGVVRIYSYNNDGSGGIATGFIISREGDENYIITNTHAVTYTFEGGIYMCDNVTIVDKSFDNGKGLISVDPSNITFFVGQEGNKLDLVMLKVDDSRLSERSVLPLRRTDELGLGNSVYTLGFPGIADNVIVGGDDLPSRPSDATVTAGIVSKLNATMLETDESENEIVIQHTAQINGGNSGGPLLDKTGAVVGVNTWSTVEVSGLFFSGVSDYIIDNANSMNINITVAQGNETAPAETTTAQAGEETAAQTTTAAQAGEETSAQAAETTVYSTAAITPYEQPTASRNGVFIGITVALLIVIAIVIIIVAVSANKKAPQAEAVEYKYVRGEPQVFLPPPEKTEEITEPSNAERIRKSSNAERIVKPSNAEINVKPSNAERVTKSSYSEKVAQPSYAEKNTQPSYSAERQESKLTAAVNASAGQKESPSSNRPYTPPAPPPPRKTIIKGTAGNFAGRDFPLEDNSVLTFGRRPQNNVCFPSSTEGVSGDHCELRKKGNYVCVIDKNSSYGTFVNKKKIAPNTEVRLNDGDRIELGSEKQSFSISTK
jgi:S1-C subfamily serine protease